MGRDFTPERIADLREDIPLFARLNGLRTDWHEPDEQGVTAKVYGKKFDNAYGIATRSGEIVIYLRGQQYETLINLADLLADYCRLVRQASGF